MHCQTSPRFAGAGAASCVPRFCPGSIGELALKCAEATNPQQSAMTDFESDYYDDYADYPTAAPAPVTKAQCTSVGASCSQLTAHETSECVIVAVSIPHVSCLFARASALCLRTPGVFRVVVRTLEIACDMAAGPCRVRACDVHWRARRGWKLLSRARYHGTVDSCRQQSDQRRLLGACSSRCLHAAELAVHRRRQVYVQCALRMSKCTFGERPTNVFVELIQLW